ncbi:hypothetical protein [Streptomyces sp. NPDC056479]|uniref:hypothetical protein n=1 Tax=unclassified Streptomyces TaxID=2593676 RepID=UPI00368CF6EB
MAEVQTRWWGLVVSLDRSEGDFAATGIPVAGELLVLTVPLYGPLILAAIEAHKQWIGSRLGTEGVDLHLNWAGFLHWVETRGELKAAD